MIRQTSIRTADLTRELAEDFATMPKWKGERDLVEARKQMIIEKIRRGLFYSPTWAHAKLNWQTMRVNGQHSSAALLECETFPVGMKATIIGFEVDTEAEMAILFDQFDNPESARQMKDTIRAHAAVEIDLAECSVKTLQTILSGMEMASSSAGKLSRSDRAAMLHSEGAFIAFARQFATCRHIMFRGVMAAMHLTWKRDQVRANEFWHLVSTEEHQDSSNSTRVLARFLNSEIVGRCGRAGMRWDKRATMVKCLHGWNAYWRKLSTSLKYVKDAPIPPLV
jgi:hypothetical protein